MASQIRQAERATLASVQHSSMTNGFQLNIAMPEPATAELVVKGSQEPDALDPDPVERLRITRLLRAAFAWYEDVFNQARAGMVDVGYWQNHRTNILGLLRAPGLREWWRHEQGFFSERFRDEVNRQFAAQPGAAADEPQHG